MATGATDDEAESFIDWTAGDMSTGGYDTDYEWGRARTAAADSTDTTPWRWSGGGIGYLYWWSMAATDHPVGGDLTGDGPDELLFLNSAWSHLYTWSGSNCQYLWGTGGDWIHWWKLADDDRYVAGDFDSDDDLFAPNDPWARLMEWNGSSFDCVWGAGGGAVSWWDMADSERYLTVDFDGDGAAELFSANDPWAHRQSFTGSGWTWDWGQGAGLVELWYQDDGDTHLAGEFALGAGNEDLVALKAPGWHLMVGVAPGARRGA